MFLIFDVRKTDWLVKQFTLNRKVNGKRFPLFRDQTRSKISVVISLKCNLFEKNVIKANENPKISRFQSTCQVHNWKSHFWKTQVYHYNQHPDPVFFRRNVTVVDHYRTWNQTWRILIFSELKNSYWEMQWVEIFQNESKWWIKWAFLKKNKRNSKMCSSEIAWQHKIMFSGRFRTSEVICFD